MRNVKVARNPPYAAVLISVRVEGNVRVSVNVNMSVMVEPVYRGGGFSP